ncbi:MAG: Gfo/Idh/MocA family oxidoreductase [Deltaproteobacteria bacterium]
MIKVAVIGVGYLGRYHAEKYARMDGVKLVGVVDTDLARAEEVARATGSKPYSRIEEIEESIDAASIVVPTVFHRDVTQALLSRGVHCLVEKPFTKTVEEADELIELARKKGLVLQVGHIERFNPAVAFLIEHARNPLFIEAHRLSGFKERALDVDVVLDLMIHDIDIVLTLVPSPLKEFRAVGVPVLTPTVDIANVRLIFENGCTANLTASRISLRPMRRVRIFQPGCYISADCAEQSNLIVTRTPGETGFSSVHPDFITRERSDILFEEIAAFIRAIRGEDRVVVTGEDGRNALKLATDITCTIQEAIRALPAIS